MKLRFIVNTRSGRAARALPFVRQYASERGFEIALTERARHGRELALRAVDDGFGVIVAVGGDGTMNEVASALVGTPATLGLIPCGSGDGLGRHLRIHGPVSRALDILDTGKPRLIDTGMADGHCFFTAAGIGFEAEIASRFNQLVQRGFLRYVTTSARLFREWKPERYTITTEQGTEQREAFTLVVANADQYGNNALIAPGAAVDDGRLNLTAVPPVTLWNGGSLLFRLFSGGLSAQRGIAMHEASRFVVERERAGLLHTDGELHEAGPVIEFAVQPRSLRVMCPADRP